MTPDRQRIPHELTARPKMVVSAPLIFSWRPSRKITMVPAVSYADLLSAGSALLKGGVNVIPVNDHKTPIGEWKCYQTERTTVAEHKNWCRRRTVHGLAMIGGEISGGLVVLDFDVAGFFERFVEEVKRNLEVRELAYLLPAQQTGSGKYQMAFRCGLSLRNDKLAWVPADNTQGREAAIETRAEGGYAVVSPSYCPKAKKHGVYHEQAYQVIQGDFARIPTITDRQAQILIDIARRLDEMPLTRKEMKAAPLPPNRNGEEVDGGVIGAFNRMFHIRTILERNSYERRGNRYLAPDSTTGLPGVHIFEDTGRCYSHHSNDSLNDGHSHDAFSAFSILEHGGDVRAAVKAAAAELVVERPHERPQATPADDGQDYDRAEREVIREEAQAAPQMLNVTPMWPQEVMTGAAGIFSRAYADYLETPEQFLFMSYLTLLGHALVDNIVLESEIEPQPRLFTVNVGESADARKSTSISKTNSFFLETIAEDDFNPIWGVGSAEGLAKCFEKNNKVLLILDELQAIVQKMRIDASVLLPCINALFEGNKFHNITKKQDIQLNNAKLCILAASTLDTYRNMFTSSFTNIGFLNRLFIVIGDGNRKFSIPNRMPDNKRDSLKNDLREVLSFVGELSRDGCYSMTITPQAREIFDAWYFGLEHSIFIKRLDTYGHRLMPLLAVNELKDTITPEIAQRVVGLLNYQLAARKFADPIDADNLIARIEERIRRLLKPGPLAKRDLERAGNKNRAGIGPWEQAIKGLINGGEIYVKNGIFHLIS